MSYPCIHAARHFRAAAHLPLLIAGERLGWMGRDDLPLLALWPELFHIGDDGVRLDPALDSVEQRSAALDQVARTLAEGGRITGWRDETYAVRASFDAAPVAMIERAAARFFGTLTFGVHANGIVADEHAPHLWLARRSLSKPIDPGKYDNLVGGGIAWGYSVVQTLVKECWEESGVSTELVARARPGSSLYLLQEVPEGVQAEQLFVYDLELPPGFKPANQDGEVSEYRLVSINEALRLIAAEALTVDASLVTLDWLLRSGRVRAGAPEVAGFEALLRPF
jgi:8-oxo-dGTP pyrophosphatase MutT (NUDIX family)